MMYSETYAVDNYNIEEGSGFTVYISKMDEHL